MLYYLFEYLLKLSIQLQAKGFSVKVLTADQAVFEKFRDTSIQVSYLPFIIRLLLRRSGNILFRISLWISGYFWMILIRDRYDFAIVPWDNKPIWYLILKNFPSLTVHNTTNLMDLDFEIESYKSNKSHKIAKFFEGILLCFFCQTFDTQQMHLRRKNHTPRLEDLRQTSRDSFETTSNSNDSRDVCPNSSKSGV